MRRTAAPRIANDCLHVIVTLALCSFGSHALVARSSIQPPSSPVPIAAGATHSIAVTSAGQVWTWGDNHLGQLGTGDTTNYASPVPVTGLNPEFIAVGAGLGHSLALDYLGRVWSWGLNADGQLGDGSRTRRLAPILVAQASNIVAIAAGSVHSLALRSDGRVLAWGGNLGAQLGDGTNTGRTLPVLIAGLTDVIAIAAGTVHSLALCSDGSVWAWGTNLTGQLGIGGSALIKKTPTRVTALAGITAIAAGGGHSAAVSSTGAVWAWGWNAFGQVGDGSRTTRRTPLLLAGISGAVAVSAGGAHTLATTTGGTMYAWGGNDLGQLGDGTTSDRLVPTAIVSPANVVTVAAGAVHSLLLTGELTAWSWGNNLFGQLGDGSLAPSMVPIPITGLESGVAAPTFSPAAGTYDQPIEVTISTATPDATVYYTTNGDDPTEDDAIASDPFETYPIWIGGTTQFKARAFKPGMAPSPVSQTEYVLNIVPPPDQPTFSHEGGFFSSPLDVEIFSTTPGAEIRYTLDESEPTATSELYVGPLHIATRTLIKARAFLNGRGSDTAAVLFMFDFGRAATPTATPAAGMYEQPQSVTLSAQPGASIYYTLNGGTPSEGSTLYESPVLIASNLTLRARAFHPDYTQSLILTVDYIIDNTPTGLPVDPSTIAPPVDKTEQTDFAEATEFLYTGPNRVQRFVTPGAIDPARVTVLRGKVNDRDGQPVSGIRISVPSEPQIGYTLSRTDGMFDIAVNGGGRVTIDYSGDGYLPVQRTIATGWNDYVWAPDVVMTALDANVTVVPMGSSEALAARGSAITDADGSRQATLIVPEGGVVANIELPDGTRLSAVSQLSIRATEYTIGPNGRAAMPGDLPNTSGYTYAVELSADEAIAARATRVSFDRPLPFYVENFLGFPVGGAVPTGYYDRQRGEWIASDNGRIVGIVSETGGAADLDLNGDGLVDDNAALTALGVTEGERRRLAVLYEPGQSLWRVPIPHFTPWDHNWPYRAPEDAEHPNAPDPQQRDRVNDGCEVNHSIVECESQGLGERVGIAGTPFTLNYRSNRQPGSAGPSTISIPLTGSRVPASLNSIELEVLIAGRRFAQEFPPVAGANATIAWDGKDAYGRTVYGGHSATVLIKHVYQGIYSQPWELPRSFAQAGQGPITANRGRNAFEFEQKSTITMRAGMSPAASIGGWSLDAHHTFDRIGNTIWLGDGGRRDAGKSAWDLKDWEPRIRAERLNGVLPDGAVLSSDQIFGETLATRGGSRGGLWMGLDQDQIPAECRNVHAHVQNRSTAIASGSGGQIYYSFTNADSNGHNTRLCFGRASRTGPANTGIFTSVAFPQSQVQVLSYMGIDAGGIIYAAAGRYLYQLNPGGTPVLVYTAPNTIFGLGLTPGGDVIMATGQQFSVSLQAGHLRRRSSSGQVTLIGGAAEGQCTAPRLDGPFDPTAVICPDAVTVASDGSVIFVDRLDTGNGSDSLVRRIWPDGFITTLVRTATFISDIAMVRDDEIYAVAGRVTSIVPAVAENLTGAAAITSSDGSQLYEFAPSGRHLRTLDPITGVTLFTFGYNPQGYLTAVTNRHGQITTIERDGSGAPQAIVGAFGHRTALQINSDGYLTSITDPAGGRTALDYRAGGLLSMFSNANNHASHFDYDSFGRLISDRDAAGGELTLTRTNLPTGWSVLTENALGHQETYTVAETAPGRNLRTRTFADGTTFMRQDLADGTEEVSPDGTRTRVVMAPDPRFGRQAEYASSTTKTTPSGLAHNVTVARSPEFQLFTNPPVLRRLVDTTRINNRQYSSVFDVTARTVTLTTPMGRQSVTTLDAQGRVSRMRYGTRLAVDFTYDAQSRLSTMAQGSRVRRYAYSSGSLSSFIDPLSQEFSFDHDAAGRVIRRTRPDDQHVEFGFDLNGNLTRVTPPGRAAHTFSFTPVDRVEHYQPPAVTGATDTSISYTTDRKTAQITRPGGQVITAVYDTAGRLDTLTAPSGAISHSYDPDTGRLRSMATPASTLTFSFDGSLPIAQEWSGAIAGRVQWTYDSNFRRVSEIVGGLAIPFEYDLDGLLTAAGALSLTRDAANGVVTAEQVGPVSTTFTYDDFGDVLSRQTTVGSTAAFGVTYSRDALGRIVQLVENELGGSRTDTFTYDGAGRLTAVTRNGAPLVSYGYDANGNRTSETSTSGIVTATYDAQDRLVSYGATTYAYTLAGDLQSRTDPESGTTTYQYDAFGNLRSVALPAGEVVEYIVDGAGRRIGRRLNGVFTTGLIYQNGLRPVAEVNAGGAVVTRFVYGTAINVPDYMVRGTSTFRMVRDHLGSVRLVVDVVTGAIAQRLDYDPFGRVVTDTNPGFQPFGFAGGLYDPLTGLVRFGARDYDANVGRWTAKDPLGFAAGDSNLYAYVGNDPVNLIDPTGLCPGSDDGSDNAYLRELADLFAGLGDEFSSLFGLFDKSLTELIREWLGIDVVDPNSPAYRAGEWGAWATAALAAVGTALGVEINILSKGNVFKIISQTLKQGFRVDPAHHGKPWGHTHYWRW